MANEKTLFTTMVDQKCPPKMGLLSLFTSSASNIFSGRKIEFDKIKSRRLTALAKERGSNATKNGSEDFSTAEYTPPIYKESRPYNIDNFQSKVAGETIYDDAEKELLIMDKTAEDLVLLKQKIDRAMLLQASYILQTGGIPFKTSSLTSENVADIDFETPATLLADLTGLAGSLFWDDADATPISDMEDRITLIETEGCTRVNKIILGSAALDALTSNTKVMAILENRRISRGSFVYNEQNDMGMSLVGVFSLNNRNVEFWTYKDYYLDPADNATTKEYIDPENVLFIGDGDYQIFYAGIDAIKDVKPLDFLGTNNIRQIGTTVASSMYIDTHSDNENQNVWLRLQMAPLLVPKTNDTFGKMRVLL